MTRELSDEDLRLFEWSGLRKAIEEHGVRRVIGEILDYVRTTALEILPRKPSNRREEVKMGARMIVLAPVDSDPRIQKIALRPLIVTTVDRRGKIKEILHIEKHEVVCDLCGGLIALTKKELEERARDYAVIVDGRAVQIICETCRRRFWGWA
jgi:hypothetical protein